MSVVDGPREWIFTFREDAEIRGESLRLRFARVHGTYHGARDLMDQLFGDKWECQYSSTASAGITREHRQIVLPIAEVAAGGRAQGVSIVPAVQRPGREEYMGRPRRPRAPIVEEGTDGDDDVAG